MTDPARRISARVLPVSPDGACLLLRELDPQHPDEPYWSSIGGGIDAGESLPVAAARELREETGIVIDPAALIGPVAHYEEPFTWNGLTRLGDSTYFALACDREVEISFEHLGPEEVGTVLGAAWWHPDQVADLPCRPTVLPELMRAAITRVGETASAPEDRADARAGDARA